MQTFNMIYYWCVFILLFAYAISQLRKNLGAENQYSQLTHGKPNEGVDVLLERIDYANNINGKIHFQAWIFVQSTIITFVITHYLYNGFCGIDKFLAIVLIITAVLSAARNYYEHHICRFNHYFTDQNIKNIREQLGIRRRVEITPTPKSDNRCDYYRYKQ
jgi:hypothetical protein